MIINARLRCIVPLSSSRLINWNCYGLALFPITDGDKHGGSMIQFAALVLGVSLLFGFDRLGLVAMCVAFVVGVLFGYLQGRWLVQQSRCSVSIVSFWVGFDSQKFVVFILG